MAKSSVIETGGVITYGGHTYPSRLRVEYEHTGIRYIRGRCENRYTCNPDIAKEWEQAGVRVKKLSGYYYISRIAMVHNDGSCWYITNGGDNYVIEKASKRWKRIHNKLSKEVAI